MKFNGDSSFARTLNSYASGNWELPKSEPTFKITNYPAATMRHLRIVQEECKKIGAKLVLSTVPTNSYNPKYRVLARSIGKQLGLDFIQGNNATTNLADFSDGVHLNAVGARKLSELIGTELRAILRK
jgi:lysophospholipase L1-like esterase